MPVQQKIIRFLSSQAQALSVNAIKKRSCSAHLSKNGGVDIQEHPKMINIGLLGLLEYDS